MNKLFLATLLLTGGHTMPVWGADDSKDPVEVDFAALPCGQTDFALHYGFHTHADVGVSGVRHIKTEMITEVRDHYFKSLRDDGWVVKSEGKTKLVVYGRKGDPIQSVKFRVDTFEFKPKGNVTPTVRRVKEV